MLLVAKLDTKIMIADETTDFIQKQYKKSLFTSTWHKSKTASPKPYRKRKRGCCGATAFTASSSANLPKTGAAFVFSDGLKIWKGRLKNKKQPALVTKKCRLLLHSQVAFQTTLMQIRFKELLKLIKRNLASGVVIQIRVVRTWHDVQLFVFAAQRFERIFAEIAWVCFFTVYD